MSVDHDDSFLYLLSTKDYYYLHFLFKQLQVHEEDLKAVKSKVQIFLWFQ